MPHGIAGVIHAETSILFVNCLFGGASYIFLISLEKNRLAKNVELNDLKIVKKSEVLMKRE